MMKTLFRLRTLLFFLFGGVLLAVSAFNGMAQDPFKGRPSRERMFTNQLNFIVKDLTLTPAQMQAVTSALKKVEDSKFELWKEVFSQHQIIKEGKATEEQISRLLEAELEARVKDAMLERDFYISLKNELTPSQLWHIREAHRTFAKQMFRKHGELCKGKPSLNSKAKAPRKVQQKR